MDKQFKIKPLEEVKILQDKTLNEIKRDYKIMTVFMAILIILALVICFKAWSLAIDYEALECEKQELEQVVEMQIEYKEIDKKVEI